MDDREAGGERPGAAERAPEFWRSGARPRRADVAATQDGFGAAAAAG